MFAAFIFFAVIHYRNNRKLRFATAIRDNGFLNEWLAEHRHIRPIEIMQLDRIISPLAVGIFKPRIILPKMMDMSDKQLMNYVLTHEYYHIKRYDALWKILLAVALCVHWFNPLVWLMFVLASRDLELTCDEAVIRRFGAKTRKDYAYMLIGMVEQGSKFAPLYNGFSKNATHERIESIMKNKKLTLASVILAVALVSVLTV
jgi:beta-lactamase regulating signal transducer with metallopeptidase domain